MNKKFKPRSLAARTKVSYLVEIFSKQSLICRSAKCLFEIMALASFFKLNVSNGIENCTLIFDSCLDKDLASMCVGFRLSVCILRTKN
uniref:Uncharacterized protein n=1 Tax=Romanomermis culicivorax TaxID=13658 RepID=A0A915JNN8_ROMCU